MQPFVVRTREDALGLLNELIVQSALEQNVVGLDTETTGCNPSKESPVGRARLFCMTVAWGPPRAPDQVGPSGYRTAYIPREHVEHFRLWLEHPEWLKVGTNIYGYDRHVFGNEGVELRGVAGCTSAMSRLLNPGKDAGHGLKTWGERLGYPVHQDEYERLTTVAVPGKAFKLRTSVRWVQKELEELWANYPDKRKAIVEYACQDPAMSLDVFHHLRRQLEGVQW